MSRPKLIPQPHGGALLSGGIPGGMPGPGRPPSALRERLRGTVEDRVKILEQILDDPETSTLDRIRCVDILLKYGLGTAHEIGGMDGGPILIQAEAEKAREEVRKKLKRLAAESRKPPDPRKIPPSLPELSPVDQDDAPSRRKPDPDEVIAVFEDRGTGIKTQEPTEKVEAEVETETRQSSWPPPGRAFVTGT